MSATGRVAACETQEQQPMLVCGFRLPRVPMTSGRIRHKTPLPLLRLPLLVLATFACSMTPLLCPTFPKSKASTHTALRFHGNPRFHATLAAGLAQLSLLIILLSLTRFCRHPSIDKQAKHDVLSPQSTHLHPRPPGCATPPRGSI